MSRVPLRRQKLPNVHVSPHDPENTFDCSFIESPSPSTADPPTPSGSSRGSRYSAETPETPRPRDPPGGLEAPRESESNAERANRTETTLLLSDDEEEDLETPAADPVPEVGARITEPCLDDPGGLGGGDPTHGSPPAALGSDSPRGRSRSTIPPPPPAAPREGDGGTNLLKENTKSKTAERVKPRPPDPSTKPRPSWIHQQAKSPKQKTLVDTIPCGTKSSEGRPSGETVPTAAVSPGAEETETEPRAEQTSPLRNPSGFLPLEPINRAMQNVLRQIRHAHTDGNPKTSSKTSSGKHADGQASNRDVRPPQDAAARQNSRILKSNDFNGCQESSQQGSPPSARRNKNQEPSRSVSGTQDASPRLTSSGPPNGDALPKASISSDVSQRMDSQTDSLDTPRKVSSAPPAPPPPPPPPPPLTPRLICSNSASPPWSKIRSNTTAPSMMVTAKVEVLRKSIEYTVRASAMLSAEWRRRKETGNQPRSLPDNNHNRKKHLNGVQHHRAKKAWFDRFKDTSAILQDEQAKKPCRRFLVTGSCGFGSNCRFSHMSEEEMERMQMQVEEPGNGTMKMMMKKEMMMRTEQRTNRRAVCSSISSPSPTCRPPSGPRRRGAGGRTPAPSGDE
ncbi:hypothetical protein CRUP_038663 [Coryphaenoides rupestris]|nr:hypothetical protein CRUP_038663 [Coryphaenoides rupestris]